MFTSLDYWLDAMFSCCLDFMFTLVCFGFTIGFYVWITFCLCFVLKSSFACATAGHCHFDFVFHADHESARRTSPLRGDTVTGRSSGTHIYSEVAPFPYLAINSIFSLDPCAFVPKPRSVSLCLLRLVNCVLRNTVLQSILQSSST